jgi:hypothetical protein
MKTAPDRGENDWRDVRQFGKVAQALEGFEQHEHEELPCRGGCLSVSKREFFRRRCIQVSQFLRGERRLEARIGSALNGRHRKLLLSGS